MLQQATSTEATGSEGHENTAPQQEQSADAIEQQPGESNVDFAKRFAALTRREREIHRRQQEFSQKEKEFGEKYSKFQEWEKARENAKLDPLGFLQANGLSYKEITDKILEDDNLTDEQKLERIADAKLEQYKKEQEAENERRRQEREKAEQEAKDQELINRYKNQINQAVADKPEYKFINHEGEAARDLVFEVAAEHYDRTGEVIDPNVAAKHVEAYIEKRYKEAYKLLNTEDLASDETQQEVTEPQSFAPKTLTNRSTLSASPSSSSETSSGYLSDEESKRRSAEMLRKALASGG